MVQISSGGFLPLLIWIRNLRLGQFEVKILDIEMKRVRGCPGLD
jgi:hypothetical protein